VSGDHYVYLPDSPYQRTRWDKCAFCGHLFYGTPGVYKGRQRHCDKKCAVGYGNMRKRARMAAGVFYGPLPNGLYGPPHA
jgi:hypothetical protein